MSKFIGTSGTVTVNSVTMNVLTWKSSEDVPDINTTDVSGNYYTNISGIKKLTVTGKVQLDASSPLVIGAVPAGTSAAGTLNIGATGKAITGTFRVTKWDTENPAEEAVTAEFTMVSNGSYTLPT